MTTTKEGDGVDEVTSLLQKTEVKQQNIVTFKGKSLKLDKEEDAEEVIKAIRSSPDLQVLELCGNTVGVEAAKAIAEALKDRPELQRCLWADMFTGRLRAEIPPSLSVLSGAIMEAHAHLVEIDLSHNAFGPIGISSISDLLKSESAFTLEVLKFNNNGMGVGGKILAEALIECHKRSTAAGKPLALKVFIAGRNRLENLGAIALAEAFKTIGTLEEIHLPQNGINHEGITALAGAVQNCPNLKHLNLNDNTFSDKGAVSMGNAIKEIDSLEIINFGDCLVRTEGAECIGEALKTSNQHLKQLILSFGEIQLEGAIRVCEGVAEKDELELLDLNGNQFGPDGVEEITDMVNDFENPRILGSLSDDEGVESGEEDDEEEESEDEEQVEDSEQIPTTRVNGTGINGHLASHDVTSDDLPDKISAADLLALSVSKRSELLHEAVLKLGRDPEACVDACAKIAGLLDAPTAVDEVKLESVVYECADVYLRAAFQHCSDRPMLAVDRILIRAGLIKSEEKSIKALTNVRSLLQVLQHAIMQPYYPQNTKKIVRAMVAKSCKVWEKNYDLQGQLLQLLY